MSVGRDYAKTLDRSIIDNLQRAIRTTREAADAAERTLLKGGDRTRHMASDVLSRLVNGHNNAVMHVVTAVSAMDDQIECYDHDAAHVDPPADVA